MAGEQWWLEDDFATAASAKKSFGGPASSGGDAKTYAGDVAELRDASNKASAERDLTRDYGVTEKAVRDFDTGPVKARFLDMVLPDQDGGIMDTVGATVGLLARPFISDKTIAARDHLNTVSAQSALVGSGQMSGSSSDKDTALMRTAGVSPYKSTTENLRIMKAAKRDSGLEQVRAGMKSLWITRFGSIANPAPNGLSFERALGDAEKDFLGQGRRAALPKPPPSALRKPATGNSWSVREIK